MYTKRNRDSAGQPDRGYLHEAPAEFRRQLWYAIEKATQPRPDVVVLAGVDDRKGAFLRKLHEILVEEYGLFRLSRRPLPGGGTPEADLLAFVVRDASTEQLMDVIDTVPRVLEQIHGGFTSFTTDEIAVSFQQKVCSRLAEHRMAFDIVAGLTVAKDSEEMHASVVVPVLSLLSGRPRFGAAERQYQDALDELRREKWSDAITDATSAVELVLREVIGFAQGQLSALLKEAQKRGFFGDAQAARIKKVTDGFAVLADIRNQESDAHGNESDRGTAWLAVHWAGALIVYLVGRAEAAGL